MKRIIPLLLIAFSTLVSGVEPELLSPFDARVQLAKEAASDERYKPYPSVMFKRNGRHLARTMRSCIATSSAPEAKAFVLVADINSRGRASGVTVKPENEVARCFADGFSSVAYPRPPVYALRPGFPVTMKIQVRP